MTHVLDSMIRMATKEFVGDLSQKADMQRFDALVSMCDGTYRCSLGEMRRHNYLNIAKACARWLSSIGVKDPWNEFRQEYNECPNLCGGEDIALILLLDIKPYAKARKCESLVFRKGLAHLGAVTLSKANQEVD